MGRKENGLAIALIPDYGYNSCMKHAARIVGLVLLLCLVQGQAVAAPTHGVTPFGELKYNRWFEHFDYVNPKAPKGGSIRLTYNLAFDNLNPFILKGVPAPGMNYVFESLMKPSLDEPQSFYGQIAERIQVAPDKTHADFTLRRAARWHDGKPITADDVVWSFHTLKEEGHPSYRIIYAPIEKAEKLGTYKVRFHFSDPTNRELPILAASMSVLPKHYYEQVPFNRTTLTPPLGSGPYKVARVDQGRSLVFERVENYWGKDLPVNRGQYNFDRVRFDVFRDETVSVEAIKSGQYDFRQEYIARIWATSYNTPAVQQKKLIKTMIPNKIPSGMQAFIFNIRKHKFSDERVREAIGLTMDFEWMNETLFYGAYFRNKSYFQNTDFMATGIPQGKELSLLEPYRDQLPKKLFYTPFEIPMTDGSGSARENLLQAQRLLNEAGWIMKDGVRVHHETGEPLTVEFMMNQRTFEKIISSMGRNLKRLGINATFRYVDDSQYQKRIDKRDFDIISIWWNYGLFFPGSEQVGYWHSSQADVQGGKNYSGLQDPIVDDLIANLLKATTMDELTTASHAFDRVLLWKHLIIPHWYLGAWRLLYWDKFGIPDVQPSYGINVESWWSKEAEK